MLTFWVGARRAQEILYGGKLYTAEEAQALGLVDAVVSEDGLLEAARDLARRHAARDPAAFRSMKGLLRRPVIEDMSARGPQSIREFVDLWYSEPTWKQLQQIEIR
jgi:enoyl-CoA hydratase/carnithine racemase